MARRASHAGPAPRPVPLAQYIGVPFVDGGRILAGCDCWGLVRLVLREQCLIELPDYGEISARDLARVTATMRREADAEPWCPVEREQVRQFDVVLMRGRPLHVGVMLSAARVLHVEAKTGSVCVEVSHPSVHSRLLGFRRYQSLL